MREGKPGTRVKRGRYKNAPRGTRPASPGGMPFAPKQCTAKKPDGSRCQRALKQQPGNTLCASHSDSDA